MDVRSTTAMLFQLGWTTTKINATLDILQNGTPSQINKLKSEIAPQLRNTVAYRTGTTK